jgi:hypothetical protein
MHLKSLRQSGRSASIHCDGYEFVDFILKFFFLLPDYAGALDLERANV